MLFLFSLLVDAMRCDAYLRSNPNLSTFLGLRAGFLPRPPCALGCRSVSRFVSLYPFVFCLHGDVVVRDLRAWWCGTEGRGLVFFISLAGLGWLVGGWSGVGVGDLWW